MHITIQEADLVKQCKTGKEEAFAGLYSIYAKQIFNSVYRITHNHADAEDITQDAFCVAFERMDKLKKDENFEGWLKRIALNKAISLVRKRKSVFLEEFPEESVADEVSDADEEMIFQCRVDDVKEAINNLSDGYRTIISLYLLENISQEEIAKMLHISHATVRSQYHRAKRKIFMMLKNKDNHGKG